MDPQAAMAPERTEVEITEQAAAPRETPAAVPDEIAGDAPSEMAGDAAGDAASDAPSDAASEAVASEAVAEAVAEMVTEAVAETVTEAVTEAVAEAAAETAAATQAASDGSGESSPEGLSAEELLPNQPDAASANELKDAKLKAVLEAIIYITDEPLTLEQISTAIEQPLERVADLLDQLAADYEDPSRGLSIREVAGGYKMATKPEHHEEVRRFVKNLNPPLKLSLPALETLAVIAYKQPITAPEIMEIRGVQGAGVLKTLLDRKLIAAGGRKQVIGKPILYKTTREFLVQFGLKDLNELPTLKEFQEIGRMDTEGTPESAADDAIEAAREANVETPLFAEEPGAPKEADLTVMPETAAEATDPSPAESSEAETA